MYVRCGTCAGRQADIYWVHAIAMRWPTKIKRRHKTSSAGLFVGFPTRREREKKREGGWVLRPRKRKGEGESKRERDRERKEQRRGEKTPSFQFLHVCIDFYFVCLFWLLLS